MSLAIVYQTRTNQPKTKIIMSPVEEGLKRVGYEVQLRESLEYPRGDEQNFDLIAIWGDHGGTERIILNKVLHPKLCHVDNSYLNRLRYEGHYGLSWGGQRQCHEYLWQSPRCPERFVALNETIQPWRTDGKHILLLAPSVKQGKILGFDTDAWARQTVNAISRYTKRRIIVSIKRYPNSIPLRQLLREESIFAAIGYNTKGLVDCLLEGIPTFSLSPCAAYSMGIHNDLSRIEAPFYPDNRQEFLERLAGTQFLLSEIAEGIPFREPFFAPPTSPTFNP